MRYAIFSDVHANLQAWQAVLTDISSSHIDTILCLGDVLGYGPNPVEVLQSIHRHVDALTLGNHDAALCGMLDPCRFNQRARTLLDWTRTRVSSAATEFLAAQPLVLCGREFRCAHGEFGAPGAFHYVLDAADALPSWQAVPEPLLFVGHSHVPGIFVIGASGLPHLLPPQDFAIEPGKRYLVNVGAVGYPRDDDVRACYCIYDDADQSVVWRRIPFDLDAHRAALAAVGMPTEDVDFLARDPRAARPTIREQLNFVPATAAAEEVQPAKPEADLARLLRRRIARWKVAAGLLALLAAAIWALLLWRGQTAPPPFSCPPHALAPRVAYPLPPEPASLLPPLPEQMAGAELPGWRYFLDDPSRQAVTLTQFNGQSVLRVGNRLANGHLRLESAPIDLTATGLRRLCMTARMRPAADFHGRLTLVLDLVCETPEGKRTAHPQRETKDFRTQNGDWLETRHTFDLLKDSKWVTLAVEGTFSGTVEIAAPALRPGEKRGTTGN